MTHNSDRSPVDYLFSGKPHLPPLVDDDALQAIADDVARRESSISQWASEVRQYADMVKQPLIEAVESRPHPDTDYWSRMWIDGAWVDLHGRPGTPQHAALETLRELYEALEHLDRAESAQQREAAGFAVGAHFMELRVRLESVPLNRDVGQMVARRLGGETRAEEFKPVHAERARQCDEMKADFPNLSKRDIARRVARKRGENSETVRKSWREHLKNR